MAAALWGSYGRFVANPMVAGIIDANFAVARIDSQTPLVAEECIARFVLSAGGVGRFTEIFRPPTLGRFHGLHRFHWLHRGHRLHGFHWIWFRGCSDFGGWDFTPFHPPDTQVENKR